MACVRTYGHVEQRLNVVEERRHEEAAECKPGRHVEQQLQWVETEVPLQR